MKLYLYFGAAASIVILSLSVWGLNSKLSLANKNLEDEKGKVKSLNAILEEERQEVIRVNSLLESLENKEAEVRYVETVVNKEIVKYRDRVVNRCKLSGDWVCIYNNSAQRLPANCGAVEVQN